MAEIPFSSDTKYMATLHLEGDGGGHVAYVKGAPERIMEFCSHLFKDGEAVELNDGLRKEILSKEKGRILIINYFMERIKRETDARSH